MKHNMRSMRRRRKQRKERQVEQWQRVPQTRRDLVARLAPVYQAASRARKQLLWDEVMQKTGYARTSAIRLLNDLPEYTQRIRRPHAPSYRARVQQALVLAWKAAHFVCAKRLMPSLPALVDQLERQRHLHLLRAVCLMAWIWARSRRRFLWSCCKILWTPGPSTRKI